MEEEYMNGSMELLRAAYDLLDDVATSGKPNIRRAMKYIAEAIEGFEKEGYH